MFGQRQRPRSELTPGSSLGAVALTACTLVGLSVGHPFVDANKRSVPNTVVVFYVLSGCRFESTVKPWVSASKIYESTLTG